MPAPVRYCKNLIYIRYGIGGGEYEYKGDIMTIMMMMVNIIPLLQEKT